MPRIRIALAGALALGLAACGGDGAVDDGPTLVEEMGAGGIECEDAGFASESGATGEDVGESSYTAVQPTDVGGCSVLDEPLSLEVFPEEEMEQVRADVEIAAEDEQDSFAVGANWVVLGDPPEVEQVAEATGSDFYE